MPFIKSDASNGEWYDWDVVIDALNNGQPVVCLQKSGLFTNSGHFIVLTGLTEDGKIIVNDPNGNNWNKNTIMFEGFQNGFTERQIKQSAVAYWIYGEKECRGVQSTVVNDECVEDVIVEGYKTEDDSGIIEDASCNESENVTESCKQVLNNDDVGEKSFFTKAFKSLLSLFGIDT